jgi:hypothetical protein
MSSALTPFRSHEGEQNEDYSPNLFFQMNGQIAEQQCTRENTWNSTDPLQTIATVDPRLNTQ